MGWFSRLFGSLTSANKKVGVLVIGLDNAGKTTILKKLQGESTVEGGTAPTVGFNVDSFSKGALKFDAFDMSGAGKYRNLWESYLKDVQAVIFVVDSADKLRLCVAKDELDIVRGHRDLKPSVPFLFFANKMEKPDALPAVEVAKGLRLSDIKDRPWQIVPSNALSGEGLPKGLEWLSEMLRR